LPKPLGRTRLQPSLVGLLIAKEGRPRRVSRPPEEYETALNGGFGERCSPPQNHRNPSARRSVISADCLSHKDTPDREPVQLSWCTPSRCEGHVRPCGRSLSRGGEGGFLRVVRDVSRAGHGERQCVYSAANRRTDTTWQESLGGSRHRLGRVPGRGGRTSSRTGQISWTDEALSGGS
jgi:hypothetical protein